DDIWEDQNRSSVLGNVGSDRARLVQRLQGLSGTAVEIFCRCGDCAVAEYTERASDRRHETEGQQCASIDIHFETPFQVRYSKLNTSPPPRNWPSLMSTTEQLGWQTVPS